jgi:hypothetical protein
MLQIISSKLQELGGRFPLTTGHTEYTQGGITGFRKNVSWKMLNSLKKEINHYFTVVCTPRMQSSDEKNI